MSETTEMLSMKQACSALGKSLRWGYGQTPYLKAIRIGGTWRVPLWRVMEILQPAGSAEMREARRMAAGVGR